MVNICKIIAPQDSGDVGMFGSIEYIEHVPQIECGYTRLDVDAVCILSNNHQGDHEYLWELDDVRFVDD
jgi:hypothetical protein